MLKFFSSRDDDNESLLGGVTEGEDGRIFILLLGCQKEIADAAFRNACGRVIISVRCVM